MASSHEDLDERLLHRLLFFTDAVFAIVLTLLVLDLKPPTDGGSGGVGLDVHLSAFATSFAIIAIFWLAHLTTTRRMKRFDWPVTVANLFFLFPICLVPFVTSWGMMSNAGWAAYCMVLVAISVANVVLSLIATRDGGRLEGGGVTARERLFRVTRGAMPGISFGIGLILLAIGQDHASRWSGALIPVLWMFTRRRGAPAADAKAA